MDIIEIQTNALKYPTQDIGKLLILGVMILFSILILPIFLALGYTIRVMKNVTEHNDTLPDFDNIGSMFIDGIKYFIVSIAYSLIPLIIMLIGFIPVMGLIFIGDVGAIFAALGVSIIFIIIGFVLSLLFSMVSYMAVVNMAHTGEFGAAFRIGEIIQRIKNIGIGTYILWFISLIITLILISILYGIVMMVPIVGFLVVILVGYPYFYLFISKSMASIYMEGN